MTVQLPVIPQKRSQFKWLTDFHNAMAEIDQQIAALANVQQLEKVSDNG